MHNPYASPTAANSLPDTPLKLHWVGWLTWGYPAFLVTALYGTWITAWCVLGAMPRPSIDDPKYIGFAVDIPYAITGLLMIGFPVAAIGGCALQFVAHARP